MPPQSLRWELTPSRLVFVRFATLVRAPAAPEYGSDRNAAPLTARLPTSMDAAELSQDKGSFEGRKRG